ncbi:hypothetical protein ACKFKG_14450 [Phormidesmis sp. 146-35]
MTNYWAIAIGINQYQHFQPLPNTNSDVVALLDFWVNEAKFASDHCVLLADVSSTPDVKAIYPSQKNIRNRIARFCQQVQSDDFLWCFFSGYGIQFEGKDYLLPIDGNLDQIPSTGILVESLFADLQSAATGNIVLVLEMHRSQGNWTNDRLGVQTVALSNKCGITTILSYSPTRLMSVANRGLSVALLEGMCRHNCLTLGQLIQYLGSRIPELSINNMHLGQNSVEIVPNIQLHQHLLSDTSGTNRQSKQLPPTELPVTQLPSTELSDQLPQTNLWMDKLWQGSVLGGMIALIGATLLNHYGGRISFLSLRLPQSSFLRSNQYSPSEKAKKGSSDKTDEAEKSPDAAKSDANSDTKTDQTKQDDQSKAQLPPQSQPSSETIAALERARKELQARQYEKALNTLDQIPENQRSDECNQLRQQVSQGLLNEARALINQVGGSDHVNQASNFSHAIAKARIVRPGDPLYDQAQKDIERWSQVILDLAQGRANQGNYNKAISAAQLISSNQKSLYPAAQESISQWQKAKANQAILEQAKLSIQRFQAPSYSQAIATIRSIQPDQPFYKEAQTLTREWSQSILSLARAHAVQGEFAEAIQTAGFVPQDTPAYQEAKTAIAQWRSDRNKQ